jgi:hypothetical protein
MNSGVTLCLLIVGRPEDLTPRAREALSALGAYPEVEAIFVDTAESPDGAPLPNGVLSVNGSRCSYGECVAMGLSKTSAEWLVLLQPEEHLQIGALAALLTELRSSSQSLRHARVMLHNPEETAREELGGAPSCSLATMLRWWRISDIPHPSAIFIRRALLAHTHEQVTFPERLGRYGIAVMAARGGASVAIPLCSSMAIFTPESAKVAERDRIRGTQLEIIQLSSLEQSNLWRDYYEWCANSNGIHFTPIMLPQSRAQAQGLATMLGTTQRSMFEALWFVYRDVETSKQAALLLTRWGLITDDNATELATSKGYKELGSYLATELHKRPMKNLLVLNDHLEAGPAPMIARILRDMGRFDVSISAVSRNQKDDRRIVAFLAQRGLLGWIRSVKPLSAVAQAGSVQRLLRRAVDEFDGRFDCVIVPSEDSRFEMEVSCVAQKLAIPFSLVVYGEQGADPLSRVKKALGPHIECSISVNKKDLVIFECGNPSQS